MKDLPVRKTIRLKGYSYRTPGYYFITICTKERKKLLWRDVPAVGTPPGRPSLSEIGEIADNEIKKTQVVYQNVKIDKYVIMPNHIHLIIVLCRGEVDGRPGGVPTVSNIINKMKGHISKKYGYSVWQPRFNDHIIRNEKEYQKIWQYIDTNPLTWEKDCFFVL